MDTGGNGVPHVEVRIERAPDLVGGVEPHCWLQAHDRRYEVPQCVVPGSLFVAPVDELQARERPAFVTTCDIGFTADVFCDGPTCLPVGALARKFRTLTACGKSRRLWLDQIGRVSYT